MLEPQPDVSMSLGKAAVPTITLGLDAYALNVTSICVEPDAYEAVVPDHAPNLSLPDEAVVPESASDVCLPAG